MKNLYGRRLGRHLIQMTKYLKYVFNDFFVIALIFLAGGLGLGYSNFLKTLKAGHVWLTLTIIAIVWFSIQLGRFATLIQAPDRVFLLPQEQAFHSYLKSAFGYSDLNASLIQIIVWFLLLPVLRIQFDASYFALGCWLIMMLVLKANWLVARYQKSFERPSALCNWWWNDLLIPLMLIILACQLPIVSAVLAVVVLGLRITILKSPPRMLNWSVLIKAENQRMHSIYRIFNWFVDVPNFGSTVRRRQYLQPLLNLVRPESGKVYLFLYSRGLVRDQEYSGLYVRLTLIGLLLIWGLQGTYLALLVAIAFIYLIIFQLIPFYSHFEANAFVHLYPEGRTSQLTSFQKILRVMMWIVTLLLGLVFLIVSPNWSVTFINLIALIVVTFGLLQFYLPRKLQHLIRSQEVR